MPTIVSVPATFTVPGSVIAAFAIPAGHWDSGTWGIDGLVYNAAGGQTLQTVVTTGGDAVNVGPARGNGSYTGDTAALSAAQLSAVNAASGGSLSATVSATIVGAGPSIRDDVSSFVLVLTGTGAGGTCGQQQTGAPHGLLAAAVRSHPWVGAPILYTPCANPPPAVVVPRRVVQWQTRRGPIFHRPVTDLDMTRPRGIVMRQRPRLTRGTLREARWPFMIGPIHPGTVVVVTDGHCMIGATLSELLLAETISEQMVATDRVC